MFKVFEQGLAFLQTNMLDTTSPQSWIRSFILLRNFGLLPASIASAEQLQEAERNKPASDGNPVAYHDDMVTPVTYEIRGKVVRYSNEMLQALTSAGYAKVMAFNRVGGLCRSMKIPRPARRVYCTLPLRLAKQRRALLKSNPQRNSQLETHRGR
jgi:hypothetical protein